VRCKLEVEGGGNRVSLAAEVEKGMWSSAGRGSRTAARLSPLSIAEDGCGLRRTESSHGFVEQVAERSR
jgi:hypothetical protein